MREYIRNILESRLSIYDPIDPDDRDLFIPTYALERMLSNALVGLSLFGLPLRTRSKAVKTEICRALGYPVPVSFKKTRPKFPGQNFDVYTQKSLNVQIWNEEVDANRRYVILRIDQNDSITAVRVISGEQLASYDRTGTLTRKYQARMQSYGRNICSLADTETVWKWGAHNTCSFKNVNPNHYPSREQLLDIMEVFSRLLPMIGTSIDYVAAVQERNRGAELHAMICNQLGYSIYEDDGAYPDIANQLLEIKLQTSPTIDLGLHSPEDGEKIVSIGDTTFYSRDVRYAIFDGAVRGNRVYLQNLYLVTGEDFSSYFPLFQGKGINKKLQLPLPLHFFD